MDPGASLAKRCIEKVLGVPVEHWDRPPRQNAHDLMFVDGDRRVAVEVKQVVNEAHRAAESEASKRGYTRLGKVHQMWDVRLRHTARWRVAEQHIPAILERLEQIGWRNDQELWQLRYIDRQLHDYLERLGVESLWTHPPTDLHPPGYYLTPDGWGGIVPSVDDLARFVTDLLASDGMARLRAQLAHADADVRHAFLIFGWERMEADALIDGPTVMPESPPTLPSPIDGLWLTSMVTTSSILAWLPGRGWLCSPPAD